MSPLACAGRIMNASRIATVASIAGLLSACSNPLGAPNISPAFHPGLEVPAPRITSVTPNSGRVSGGTTITIVGSGFMSGATVDIDSSPCTSVTFISSSQLTCITPAHATGATSIVVTNPDAQAVTLASAFSYTSITAASGFALNAGGGISYGGGMMLSGSLGVVDGAQTAITGGGMKVSPGLHGSLYGR